MKRRIIAVALSATALCGATSVLPATTAAAHPSQSPRSGHGVARQVLAAGDGWGSIGSGTTGGSAARRDDVVTVRTRDQLAAAVSGDAPKIVYVKGRIDANTDSAGRKLTCADYARDGYTLPKYLETYDPVVWGRDAEPSGPVEDARRASQEAQAAQITIPIGSNTTIIGLRRASITGAALRINGTSNVIVRGLTLTDAYDCFPSWDPTDGDEGNWNSEYDTMSLTEAAHVWVDHNDFSDGTNLDSDQPSYFGRPYQVHDGLLDITNASDLVTVSYNKFHNHDKTMLIGSSDSRISDRGKLRVTLHHNEFRDLGQRVPRVRFGQVDAYNNHYVESGRDAYEYVYSWGIGVESHLVAEHNALTLSRKIPRSSVVGYYKGTAMTENDNFVNGRPVDLLAAYNAAHDPDIAEVSAFTPLPRRTVHPTRAVPWVVSALAGPRHLSRR
ncbi:MAG TPA: polysaccharide lyase family 1 protein [Propionibacteriaceae bacterium]|nr:polysaccharide lyase family 1 protein [Propionibacteriaceae bacterium]